MKSEILPMQVELFREFKERHQLDTQRAASIFEENKIFDFISSCFELLQMEDGDSVLDDIDLVLKNKGVILT